MFAKKLDRSPEKIKVFVQIYDLPSGVNLEENLRGKIDGLSEYLKKLEIEAMDKDFWDIEIVPQRHYEDCDWQLWGWRLETDSEHKARLVKVTKAIDREQLQVLKQADKLEAAKVEAAAREARERELLRILKDKYEKSQGETVFTVLDEYGGEHGTHSTLEEAMKVATGIPTHERSPAIWETTLDNKCLVKVHSTNG